MAREVLLRRLAETSLLTGAAVVVWNARLLKGSHDQVDPFTGLVTPNGHKERRPRGAAAITSQLRQMARSGRGSVNV